MEWSDPLTHFHRYAGYRYHRHMKRRTGRVFPLCLLAALLPLSTLAQDRGATTRVPTVTRLVKLFVERETALSEAIRVGDSRAIGNFLTEDFELRTGARAANPVPRAEFIQELTRTRDGGGEISQMAVHDVESAAIASFVQANPQSALFVVDVWRRAAADWKLAIRYASPVGSPDLAIPGAGSAEPEIPKKY